MSIFKLDPAFKDYIWGGTRLRDEYGKKCDYDKVAESWELSCHKDGPSVVADGEYKGLTLNEYIERQARAFLARTAKDLRTSLSLLSSLTLRTIFLYRYTLTTIMQ